MIQPIVLVHGFMGGQAQWLLQQEMKNDGRQVLPIALPGFGNRNDEMARDTITGLAQSVIADLDQLGIRQFDLLGHSMGGMVVQEVMRMIPDRIVRFVLYGTGAVGALPGRFETIAQSKARAREEGLGPTTRRIAATWFLEREQATEYEACAHIAKQTSQGAFDAGLDAMQNWSGEAHLKAIESPTLILWGDGDRTYPWSQTQLLWQSIPNARLAVVPRCAHAVHLEKPELFNMILQDFLNGH